MFKNLYRIKQILFKTWNEYDKSIEKLFKDEKILDYVVIILYVIASVLPLGILLFTIQIEDIIKNIVGIVIGIIYTIVIIKRSDKFIIKLLKTGTPISNFLFFNIVALKGNAINKVDCKQIKATNKTLYHLIKTKECRGICYQVCFYILQALKKGSIKFIGIKPREADNLKNNFTMHVIYVNEDWCFDTYTRKQYKVEKLMTLYRAKEYKSFLYKDIAGKSYQEFKEDIRSELKKWCEENDCHQKVF